MVGSTKGSETAISIFTFSWNSITTVVPRYSLSTSRSPPCPLTRLRVMPVTPARNSAALTSASRSGRTMVVMSFMAGNIGKQRAACQEKRAQNARTVVRRDKRRAAGLQSVGEIVHILQSHCTIMVRRAIRLLLPVLVPKLVTTLKGYSKAQLLADLTAGVIVGIVALPLAIAFAIASGLTPERGLYTAIMGGFSISVVGGARVQIGGATGAFVVIVAGIVQHYGIEGLTIATIMAGGILIGLGLARLGGAIKFIPYPVTIGFTSGIALIIFSSQVKDLLGLRMGTLPAAFVPKWAAMLWHLDAINWWAVAVAALALAIIVWWPRINARIPGPFVALIATTLLVRLLHVPVETIATRFGAIDAGLPVPVIPHVTLERVGELARPALAIALLAAIESLLSAVVADGLIGGRHRSNMELVAQGVANIASPIFGGGADARRDAALDRVVLRPLGWPGAAGDARGDSHGGRLPYERVADVPRGSPGAQERCGGAVGDVPPDRPGGPHGGDRSRNDPRGVPLHETHERSHQHQGADARVRRSRGRFRDRRQRRAAADGAGGRGGLRDQWAVFLRRGGNLQVAGRGHHPEAQGLDPAHAACAGDRLDRLARPARCCSPRHQRRNSPAPSRPPHAAPGGARTVGLPLRDGRGEHPRPYRRCPEPRAVSPGPAAPAAPPLSHAP